MSKEREKDAQRVEREFDSEIINGDLEKTDTHLTCMGVRMSTKNKLIHLYRTPDGESVLFGIPVGTGKRGADPIGYTYKGKCDSEGVYYGFGSWPWDYTLRETDETLVEQWRVQDKAARAQKAALDATKKAKAGDPMIEALVPWAEAYRAAGWQAREHILAQVIRHITKGAS